MCLRKKKQRREFDLARNVIISREDAASLLRLYESVKKSERLFEHNQSRSFMRVVEKCADDAGVMAAFERLRARIPQEPEKTEPAAATEE